MTVSNHAPAGHPAGRATVGGLAPAPGVLALAALCLCASALGPPAGRAQAGVSARLSSEFSQVAERVAPSVVTITAEIDGGRLPGFFGAGGGTQHSSGSGVVIRKDGVILTNHHVIADAQRIEVELSDGRTLPARLLGQDAAIDLAVLRVELDGLSPARFGDSSAVRSGQWVVAVGAPFGLRHTLTAGVISSVQRSRTHGGVVEDYLQTDASINPGNSGGPLLNLRGEVIGINTAIINGEATIGFAIPSNLAQDVAGQLVRDGRVTRGWAGMETQSLTDAVARYFRLPDRSGALVAEVTPGGPAAKAGLLPGDVITHLDREVLADEHSLLRRVGATAAGGVLVLYGVRAGKRYSFNLRIAPTPPDTGKAKAAAAGTRAEAGALLGLQVRALSAQLRAEVGYQGSGQVVIVGVKADSPADRAGLHSGLVILGADLRPVRRPRDLLAAFADGKVLLRLQGQNGSVGFVLLQKAP